MSKMDFYQQLTKVEFLSSFKGVGTVYQEYGFSVLSDSVSIKVPAGTFTNCLEIVSNSRAPDAQVTRILAPKIGIVSCF